VQLEELQRETSEETMTLKLK
jgi:hypothetical protein